MTSEYKPEPKYPGDLLYRIHWLSSSIKPSDGYGRDVADAVNRMGYSSGALRAVDYIECLSTKEESDDDNE